MEGFLKLSTQVTITVLAVDSSDHITGKTGLSAGLTIYATKAGGTPATITPTVAELDATNVKGLYSLVLTTTHTNTLGELQLHITGSGMDPLDVKWEVATYLPGEAALLQADQAVNTTKVGGTTQTARDIGASVLLSAGTGTGQLDFTNGVVKSSLAQILGTALTETSGQIAAAFKQFFDVASPTGTMKAITLVATATNLTNAAGAGDLTATMKTSVQTAAAAALATDTYVEVTGAPAATATLAAKLGFLYAALRNKLEVTATGKVFYDDAGSLMWSKALTDDGTTYREAEGA